MKYAIIDSAMGSVWIDKFDTKEEAVKNAEREWSGFSKHDKDKRDGYAVVGFENGEAFDEFGEYNEIVKSYK